MHDSEFQASLRSATLVVVGGANTDIVGISDAPLLARDSNPGHVRVSAGGVGRNIAENLARLGAATRLITAFGGDAAAMTLTDECMAAGIDISASLRAEDLPGSRYLAISDADGDMALALSDMRALELITPTFLASEVCARSLDAAALVIIDANLPQSSIAYLARTCPGRLVADAVSVAKAPRLEAILDGLGTLKANALEASVLLGADVSGMESGRESALALVEAGVGRVFLTLGAAGCVFASSAGAGELALTPTGATSTTGAGDAFTAGIAAATVAKLTDRDSAAFATALAQRTMAVESSVDPGIDSVRILEAARELLS